ncbi:hypothetical protein [Chondromyces crocatus]|nr:hypothetical protein [Chondromyces crocatus]
MVQRMKGDSLNEGGSRNLEGSGSPDTGRARAAAAMHRRMRAAVALGRERLGRTRGGRFGLFAAMGVALGQGALLALLQDGTSAAPALDGTLRSAAQWLAWMGAGPLALAAANDRPGADRSEGIEVLAASRGTYPATFHAAQTLAAMQMVALVIAAPVLLLALLGAGLSSTPAGAMRALGLGGGVLAFAVTTGILLGGLASISGRIAGPRGRSLLAAIVLVPWILADLAGNARWSIPGALDAFLSLATGGAS